MSNYICRTFFYTPIFDKEENHYQESPRSNHRLWFTKFLLHFIVPSVIFLLGVFAGESLRYHQRDIETFSRITTTYYPNPIFMNEPSNASETAWKNLILSNGGFIKRPSDSTSLGVSVYHQLHCLHGIQIAYYRTKYINKVFLNEISEESFVNTVNEDFSTDHVEHCFDYLIQAMLCAADTNLEPPESHSNVTTGYGFERDCRDYKAVQSWAERWEAIW